MTVQGGGGGEPSSSAGKRRRRPELSPAQRAVALLTRREHSQQELLRKLQQRGVEAGTAQTVIDKLCEAGWQSDERFAEALLRSRASNGYGPAWIRAELGTHGLSGEQVQAAMDAFTGDWGALAADLLRRRHPQALTGGSETRRKAVDFLLRRGFSLEQARQALHRD